MGSHLSVHEKAPESEHWDKRVKPRFDELANSFPPLDMVSVETVRDVFGYQGVEDFGDLLLSSVPSQAENLDLPTYAHAIGVALGFDSGALAQHARFYFNAFSKNHNFLTPDELHKMVNVACIMGIAAGGFPDHKPEPDNVIVKSIIAALSAKAKDGMLAYDDMCDWLSSNMPCFFNGIRKWIEVQGLGSTDDAASTAWSVLHQIPVRANNVDHQILSLEMLWALQTAAPAAFGGSIPEEITLLYNSGVHGHSINRFEVHVFEYRGPTLLLIRDTNGQILAATVDTEWHEGHKMWGGANIRLVHLTKNFAISHRPMKAYLNTKDRHQEHCLAFGESVEHFRLKLSSDLQKGHLTNFGPHAAGEAYDFDVAAVEVWGCGDRKVSEEQHKQQRRNLQAAEQRQMVKRPARWEDNPDRVLLGMAGLQVEHNKAR